MKKYALIIVDMQNDFVLTEKTAVKGAKATVPAIKNAMRICHEKHIPVFHVIRAYDTNGDNAEIFRKSLFQKGQGFCIAGTDGAKIVQELAPHAEDAVVVKPRFSAFFGTV
ncbi:MAG TPA: cysteine hydrolase, partial [Desulfovibrio sp.]|nr:cysteine hydrolase [Desulfovibrio sp.]